MIVYDRQEEMIRWAAERIGIQNFRDDAHAIGMEKDGRLVAVTVFDTFSSCDCNVHIASDGSRRWCNREFVVRCMAYPFLQLNKRRITGLVPAKNEDALKFDLHFGFKVEGRLEHALPDDDIIVLGMLREKCRWLKGRRQ